MAASGSDIEFTLPAFDHLIIARFLFLFASLLFHLLFWRLQNAVLSFMIHSCILQGSLVPLFLQFAVHGNGWFLQEQQPDGSCLPTPRTGDVDRLRRRLPSAVGPDLFFFRLSVSKAIVVITAGSLEMWLKLRWTKSICHVLAREEITCRI
ncbi:hypothetical protein E2320_010470 [Naja naja]|nr:hypothetical protein E2320_010470 [Naja naja]